MPARWLVDAVPYLHSGQCQTCHRTWLCRHISPGLYPRKALHLEGPLWLCRACRRRNQGKSLPLTALNLLPSAKSPLSCEGTDAHDLWMRPWESRGPVALPLTSGLFTCLWRDLLNPTASDAVYVGMTPTQISSPDVSEVLKSLHSSQSFFPKSSLFPQLAASQSQQI